MRYVISAACLILSAIPCFSQPAKAPPKPKPIPLSEKLLKNGVKVGDLIVGIDYAGVETIALGPEKLKFEGGIGISYHDGYSDEPMLQLVVGFINTNDSKKIEYRGWGKSPGVKLTDDLGNSYHLAQFRILPHGQIPRATLYHDKPVGDVLVFERPIPKAATLTLELPGENLGLADPIKITFPKSLWSKEPEKPVKKPAPPKPPEPPKDPEVEAARKLDLAKKLEKDGLKDAARKRYREIAEQFPKTKAAEEARKLLTD